MIYKWKESGGLKADAQIVGDELERIRVHNNGRLEPKSVVEESRPKSAPLHSLFEWNDKRAADSWRREQASYIIRHIEVVLDDTGQRPPIRAFVSVQREEDRSYTSIQHALSEDELRAQVVAQAWSELEAFRKKYAELVEFARLFALIEQARTA